MKHDDLTVRNAPEFAQPGSAVVPVLHREHAKRRPKRPIGEGQSLGNPAHP
jgi:hypothetical protein